MAIPGLFYHLFLVFWNKHFYNFYNKNIVIKCPSCKWCLDLNPWPSEHESPPKTTRPGLPKFGHFYIVHLAAQTCRILVIVRFWPFIIGTEGFRKLDWLEATIETRHRRIKIPTLALWESMHHNIWLTNPLFLWKLQTKNSSLMILVEILTYYQSRWHLMPTVARSVWMIYQMWADVTRCGYFWKILTLNFLVYIRSRTIWQHFLLVFQF